MFFLLLFSGASKEIFVNISAPDDQTCENITGCNIGKANASISNNDIIHLMNDRLEDESARNFLDWFNKTTSKNLTLIGSQTIISTPKYEPSEYPAIYAENSTLKIHNITFKDFQIPILNGLNSQYEVYNCGFLDSGATISAILAFVESNAKFFACVIKNNTVNSQSLLIGLNSTIALDNCKIDTNFMDSKDIRASIHFVNSKINISKSTFSSNFMKLPLIATSNSSSITIASCIFHHNTVLCAIALEFQASVTILNCMFEHNECGITIGGQESIVLCQDTKIINHKSPELLFSLTESNLTLANISLMNSTMPGITFTNSASEQFYSVLISKSNIANLDVTMPLFSSMGGNMTIEDVVVKGISSEAEIVILSHQNASYTKAINSKFSKISSKSKVSAGFSTINATQAIIDNIKFSKNNICGAVMENSSLLVTSSNFSSNYCFPVGNSVPLAILTTSLAQSVDVTNSTFVNNTALTGSLFSMNSTLNINDSNFSSNHAVQGAAIFAANITFHSRTSHYINNSAMSNGGALSFVSSFVDIDNCEFKLNQAPEGSAISIVDGIELSIKNSNISENVGKVGTFIQGKGENLKINIENIDIDDPFGLAMSLEYPHLAVFKSARYNCKLRCEDPPVFTPPKKEPKNVPKPTKSNPPKEEDANEIDQDPVEIPEDASISPIYIFLIIPVMFILALFAFNKVGKRKLSNFINKMLHGKGKHEI